MNVNNVDYQEPLDLTRNPFGFWTLSVLAGFALGLFATIVHNFVDLLVAIAGR